MMTDLWLIAESQDKLRELWAEAERDRLAGELRRPGRPARAALAGTLRALAGYLDGQTQPALRPERTRVG